MKNETVVMPRRLTAGNGATAAMICEFVVYHNTTCPECHGDGCEDCKGIGGFSQPIPIPWTTIKEIYAKAVSLFEA
jgi:hypothetical protein